MTYPPRGTLWTPEEKITLREMWDAGSTVLEIVAALHGRSRNSVIGCAHRLRLEGRPNPFIGRGYFKSPPSRRARKAAKMAKLKASAPQQPLGAAVEAPPVSTVPPRLAAPTTRHCLFPTSPHEARVHSFDCPEPRLTGKPYCLNHWTRTHVRKGSSDEAREMRTIGAVATLAGGIVGGGQTTVESV